MRAKAQQGWTLLEIVLLVLIVGLILAGVIKGQEMITSAKVKRIAGQLDEIRAAYLGFQDRFKALPGDFAEVDVAFECAGSCLRGNGDGRIRSDSTPLNGSQVHEDLLVWTHLSLSGFLKGDYRMVDGESLATDANSPKSPFSVYMQIVFDGRYGVSEQRCAAAQPEDGRADTGRGGGGARPQDRRRQALQGRGAVLDVQRQRRRQPRGGRRGRLHDGAGCRGRLELARRQRQLWSRNAAVSD